MVMFAATRDAARIPAALRSWGRGGKAPLPDCLPSQVLSPPTLLQYLTGFVPDSSFILISVESLNHSEMYLGICWLSCFYWGSLWEKHNFFFPFMPLSNSTQALDFTDIKNTTFHKMISTFRLSLSPVLKKERNTNPCLPANTAWATLRPLKPNLQDGNRARKSRRTSERDKRRLDSCPSLGLEA